MTQTMVPTAEIRRSRRLPRLCRPRLRSRHAAPSWMTSGRRWRRWSRSCPSRKRIPRCVLGTWPVAWPCARGIGRCTGGAPVLAACLGLLCNLPPAKPTPPFLGPPPTLSQDLKRKHSALNVEKNTISARLQEVIAIRDAHATELSKARVRRRLWRWRGEMEGGRGRAALSSRGLHACRTGVPADVAECSAQAEEELRSLRSSQATCSQVPPVLVVLAAKLRAAEATARTYWESHLAPHARHLLAHAKVCRRVRLAWLFCVCVCVGGWGGFVRVGEGKAASPRAAGCLGLPALAVLSSLHRHPASVCHPHSCTQNAAARRRRMPARRRSCSRRTAGPRWRPPVPGSRRR